MVNSANLGGPQFEFLIFYLDTRFDFPQYRQEKLYTTEADHSSSLAFQTHILNTTYYLAT
jgi:hypothetical protein